MIVTFGAVPEVPVGRREFKGENHKLVVNSLGGSTRSPWGDEARAPLYRGIKSRDLAAADVVYVLVTEVGDWCTRADAQFLLDWIVARRGARGGVKMVTNFEKLDLEIRAREKSELEKLEIEVIEVEDATGEKFFGNIAREYQSA